MVKTRRIKVKSVEHEEIIMTMTMTKTIITKQIKTNNDQNENKNC